MAKAREWTCEDGGSVTVEKSTIYDSPQRDSVRTVREVLPCNWTQDEMHDKWDTECGSAFWLTDGTPTENKMTFCTYCGGKLIHK